MTLIRYVVPALLAILSQVTFAAQLSGSSNAAPISYDLTSNSADWVHFGYVPIELDRKRGVSPQITDYSSIANADPGSTEKVETGFSWNDGLSPATSVTASSTGKRVFRIGKGFRFTVPANNRMRTLRVYVGAWQAVGKFTARLSDGSSTAYTTNVTNSSGYGGRVITLNYRSASSSANLIVDYVVDRHFAGQNFITLESAALDASGGAGAPALSGSVASSPAVVNLTAVGRTDWVHWGRISDQPLDRKSGVVERISGHSTVGLDVSPSPGAAGSEASWSDGTPNSTVNGTASSIRTFDKNKGMSVTVEAGTAVQTVKAYVGLKGRARAQFRAVLSDGSRPAFTQTIAQSSGQTTYEFTLNFAAASNGKSLDISIVRTDARTSASYIGLESVKLLGSPQSNPNPPPGPSPDPGSGTGSIGDLVFSDNNANGLQDPGDTGVAGVTVRLRSCAGNTDLATTVTDGNGNYLFENLANEQFRVLVEPPAGSSFSPRRVGSDRARDSDTFADGRMNCVRALPGVDKLRFDAGLVSGGGGPVNPGNPGVPGDGEVGGGTAKLGDRVWSDSNRNGIQDPGEPGVSGVVVRLKPCAGTGDLAITTTDSNGLYRFTNVPEARYKLEFEAPNGRSFTAVGAGSSTQLDSDAQQNGVTRCLRLRSGTGRFGFDAGLIP